MSHLEGTAIIARPIEDVFDFLADGRNDPKLLAFVTTSELVAYAGGVGATYQQTWSQFARRRHQAVRRIVHYRRPLLLGIEVLSLPGQPSGRFRLTRLERGATEVRLELKLPEGGPQTSVALASRHWAAQVANSLPRLKVALESGGG